MTSYRERHHAGVHANPNAEPEPADTADLTVNELKAKLSDLDLSTSGTKQQLIDRLEQATA